MKQINLPGTKKLILDKKTIMKLNDDMMKRIEAGAYATTSAGPLCDDLPQTDSCQNCQTALGCPSGICL